MTRYIALIAIVVAAVAAAPTSGSGATTATLTVRASDYGRILFDGSGRALYAFTRDTRGRSTCSGACAAAWPPYVVRGSLRGSAGVQARLLGTIRRADGTRQVTYAGRPLYYYVGDRKPGQVRCQNVFGFGGLWLVVRPAGTLVR
jgi:predicted lipoprotein with Yx(FWY)xxD motif